MSLFRESARNAPRQRKKECYYKMHWFYYKIQQLLKNALFITQYISTMIYFNISITVKRRRDNNFKCWNYRTKGIALDNILFPHGLRQTINELTLIFIRILIFLCKFNLNFEVLILSLYENCPHLIVFATLIYRFTVHPFMNVMQHY